LVLRDEKDEGVRKIKARTEPVAIGKSDKKRKDHNSSGELISQERANGGGRRSKVEEEWQSEWKVKDSSDSDRQRE
jgi:hypothetical protein